MWYPLIHFVHVMGCLICLGVCFLTALLLTVLLQKDKCAYFINYDIALHFPSILIGNVKDSEFYANLGLHSLSRFNFHSSCMTPRSFRAFHFSIRLIRSKKAAAGICGWPQCELGLFLGIRQLSNRK